MVNMNAVPQMADLMVNLIMISNFTALFYSFKIARRWIKPQTK